MTPGFLLAALAVGTLAGATAALSGFGIGSLLTPLLALRLPMPTAIAAVTVPHLAATALRAWRLRAAIDRALLARFGLLSAAGGLAGSLLFARLGGAALARVLGALLVLTALGTLTGWAARVRLPAGAAWALGALSGLFGGLAGNQGGIRAAALLGLGLAPAAFVATSTATGLLVDLARTPLYVWRAGAAVAAVWPVLAVATLGTVAGTLLGERVLRRVAPARFPQLVGALVGALGLWLLLGTR